MKTPRRPGPMTGITAMTCSLIAVIGATVTACGALAGNGGPAPNGATAPQKARTADPAAARHASAPPASAAPSDPAGTAAGTIGRAGSFWTGQHLMTLTEPAHTGPTGQSLGPRTLLTQVLYPLAGRGQTAPARGPLPMIVFGPGFMQCGGPYSKLLRFWASAGYVVVVVNFPESDLVNQPADMSYAITAMLRRSAAAHGLFAGLISRHQIAVTGQSDGGDTVAALGASTCCTDHRVVADAVLSGAEWPPMPGTYFSARPVPMLFTQGSADTINPPGCSVAMYHADRAWARYYLDLFGASHTVPYWGVNKYERIVARVTLHFFDRYVLGHAGDGRAMTRQGDVAGLAALYSHGAGQLKETPCSG